MSGNEKGTVWYMDGELALYYDERKPDIGENRAGIIEYLVVPSDAIRLKYNIEEDRLNIDLGDGRQGMWVEYKEELTHWATRGVKWPKLVIMCGFDGTSTDFMKKVDEKNLLYLIDHLRRENFDLRMLIEERNQTVNELRADHGEYMRKLTDMDKLKNFTPKDEEYDTGAGGQ